MSKSKTIPLSELKSSSISDEKINTGILAFDAITGGGFGTSGGSIIQIVSESGLGKSTIACQISMQMIYRGWKVLYIDTEGSISYELLSSTELINYIDSSFFLIRETTFKNIEKVLDSFISTHEINLIVIDSIAAIMHDGFAELSSDKDSGEKNGPISITTNNSNYNSRQLTLLLNKYSMICRKENISILYINQFRTRITNLFNYAEQKVGGAKSVKYASDIILKVSSTISRENKDFTTFINKDSVDANLGKDLEFEVIKSNNSRSGRKIPFRFIYGRGISLYWTEVYALFKKGILINNRGNYSYTPYDEKNSRFLTEQKVTYKGYEGLLNNHDSWSNNSRNSIIDFYINIK